MRLPARPRRSGGFTLIETVVALAILSLALMAIFDLNAGAVGMHAYSKRVTVASLLARSKMTDLEQMLYDEGFSTSDDEESGDFSKEGWPNFKWRARILAPRTTGVSTDQLLAALFNLPTDGEGGSDVASLMSMFGAQGGAAAGAEGAGGAASLIGGAMAGMAQQQLTQFLDQITQTVREVHLTVTWRDGTQVETLDVVTHVISLGKGTDRNGPAGAGTGSATPGGQPTPPPNLVNAATGEPPQGAPVFRGGIWRDSANNQQLIPLAEFQQRQRAGPFPNRPPGRQR